MSSPSTVIPFQPQPESFVQAAEAWLDKWHEDPRLSQSDKNLCTRLYRHFNRARFERTGELLAWPGWATLMAQAGLSKMSVFRGLRRLEKLGGLKILHGGRDAKTGWKLPNQYLAIIPLSRGNRLIPGQVTFNTKTRYQDVTRLVEERLVEKDTRGSQEARPELNIEKGGNPRKEGQKSKKSQFIPRIAPYFLLRTPYPPVPRAPLLPITRGKRSEKTKPRLSDTAAQPMGTADDQRHCRQQWGTVPALWLPNSDS
jgi:hypothetical protein